MFLILILVLSLLAYPLPIPIFFTLVYTTISYSVLFSFKFVERYPGFIEDIFEKFPKKVPKIKYWILIVSFVFVIIALIIFVIIPFEKILVDVDDAIISAVQGFVNGINPYQHPIVTHTFQQNDVADIFTSDNSINNNIYGTYNYLPLDLILYSIFYVILSPIVGNNWFFLTNAIVIVICIFLFKIEKKITLFKSSVLFLPVIFLGGLILNDIWLILFYLLFFIWYNRFKTNKFFFLGCVLLLTFGFLTKMLLIFLLPVFLYYYSKDWSSRIKYLSISGLCSFFIICLFDFVAVFESVFLFHSDMAIRGTVAYVGGYLAIPLEWMGLNFLYVPLFILSFFVLLFTAPRYSSTIEGRFLYISALIILILPSGNFLPFLLTAGIYSSYQIYKQHCTTEGILPEKLVS